jgi:hypothetical protein
MNARLLWSIAAIVMVFAVASCNESTRPTKLDSPSSTPPLFGLVELKPKWVSGEHFVEEFDIDQTMLMKVPAQPAPINQHVTIPQKFSLRVVDARPDGSHELELEYLDTGPKTEINGVHYDRDPALTGAFAKFIGCKIQYFLDTSNNVERVDGIDELLKHLSAGNMTGVLRSRFNADYFKQFMIFDELLPQNPTQPGDSWSAKIEFPRGALGTYNLIFRGWELIGKRNCARIEMNGDIRSDPMGRHGPMGATMTIPEGGVSGVIWFDPEIGAVLSGKIKINMTVLMRESVRPGASAFPTQTITNQLAQVIDFGVDSLE